MHLTSRFDALTIRTRAAAVMLAALLPFGLLLFALLVHDARQARDTAHQKVRLLATAAADDLQRELDGSRRLLENLAARPAIRSLDPDRCDPIGALIVPLRPEYLALDVRDLRGTLVCSNLSKTGAALTPALEARWFHPALQRGDFHVSDVAVGPRTGKRLIALSTPIRDADGRQTGLLVLAIDLMTLNRQLLATTPPDAVVTVADARRAIVLRSAQPEVYIGTRPREGEPDPAGGRREGFLEADGRDGVPRVFSFLTLAGTDWRVAASLPRAQVLAEFNDWLMVSAAVAVFALLAGAVRAWHLSVGIVRPVSRLQRAAARLAAGDVSVRAQVDGPAEIRAVARQFNDMLEARLQAEARIRGIVDNAVDGIVTADEEQLIVQANPAALAMFHCAAEDMVGAPLARFIPQRQRDRHAADVRAFGEGESLARHMGRGREVGALRADGVEFEIEASISHMTIGGKHFYTVIHRDVTERKRAQAEIRAGRAKLDSALRSMSDAVLIADVAGRGVEINEAAARFYRFATVDACKAVLADHPDVIEMSPADGASGGAEARPEQRALRGETASGVEYRLRRTDTGETWVGSYSFAPIREPGGSIAGVVVVCRDITAAKAVQAELEASHAALRRLVSARDRIQEEERARIARELHDDLQQSLAAIRIDLAQLGERLADGPSDESSLLGELDALTVQTIASTRRIVNDLRPRLLEELGLGLALDAMARQVTARSGIDCRVVAPEAVSQELAKSPALATCLFRVAQEALNNAVKHSGAASVQIRLATAASGQVSMSVIDDGRGIRAADRRKKGSHGILGMSERVQAQGGTLRVVPLAEGGTLLEVLVPLGGDGAAPAQTEGPEPPLALESVLAGPTPNVQAIVDAMPGSVAVLDGSGVIRLVNRGWTDFAEANGWPGSVTVGPGVDYLAVCRRSALDDAGVAAILQGLTDVVERRRATFAHDYPCHLPSGPARFRMYATALADAGVLVLHVRIAPEPEPESPVDVVT